MDILSVMIGLIISLVSVPVGYAVRTKTHCIIPLRDPIFIGCLVLEGIAFMPLANILDPNVIATAFIGFDVGLLIGHIMCRPGDVRYMDLPTEGPCSQNIGPVVYYAHGDRMYIMPQRFIAIVMSFMGIRHPCDMPVHEISRTRSMIATDGLLKLRQMDVVPASLHYTEKETVPACRFGSYKTKDEFGNITRTPRYLFHFEVTKHIIRFSQTVTDDYHTFWTSYDVYKKAIEECVEAEERAARLEILNLSQKFEAAADLISGLVSLSTDAPGAHDDIIDRIRKAKERFDKDQQREYNHEYNS